MIRPRKEKPDNRPQKSTDKLSDILPALCQQLAFDQKIGEFSVLKLWDQELKKLLPQPHWQGATQAVAVHRTPHADKDDDAVLTVRVKSAPQAAELSFHLETLREALNRYAPQTGIKLTHIHLQVR